MTKPNSPRTSEENTLVNPCVGPPIKTYAETYVGLLRKQTYAETYEVMHLPPLEHETKDRPMWAYVCSLGFRPKFGDLCWCS